MIFAQEYEDLSFSAVEVGTKRSMDMATYSIAGT
jgi:hypothetical protein